MEAEAGFEDIMLKEWRVGTSERGLTAGEEKEGKYSLFKNRFIKHCF